MAPILLLLAQLAAPPLQQGPARLPIGEPLEQRARPGQVPAPVLNDTFPKPNAPRPAAENPQVPPARVEISTIPSVKGHSPYGRSQLQTILHNCRDSNAGIANNQKELLACAAALTARLTADGYINSRVYILPGEAGAQLEIVEGQIVEIHIRCSDAELAAAVRRKLRPLIGQVLHLPTLEGQLALLKSLPGVGQLRATISKLGSDPRQVILTLTLQRQVPPWLGLIELRNDGNSGTGQWRSLATVVKNDLALRGDTLLFYGEIDGSSASEFGASVGSISYTLPLGQQLKLIDSIGFGRSQIIEGDRILRGLSYQQLQNLTQLEWTIKDSLNNNIYAFAGLSASRIDGFLNDQSAPVVFGGGTQGWLSTGYIRAGIGFSSIQRHWMLSGSLYGLQGLAGFSSEQQLAELITWGIDPNRSRALASQFALSWKVGQSIQLNLRAAAQLAFAPLTSDMRISVGSNNGIRGLPGSVISGDNGLLGSAELNWTLWQGQQQALQLVPFMGAGAVRSSSGAARVDDGIGSFGLLGRWLGGRHYSLELGWVQQFSAQNNPGYWNSWLLGSGLYSKIQYRF